VIGGSACPPAMIALPGRLRRAGAPRLGHDRDEPARHVGTLKAKHAALPGEERIAVQAKQGRPPFGVEMKIVDDDGKELPWDGKAFGDLLVRGPGSPPATSRARAATASSTDGWFPTGDVATIDPDGYMQITDRSKDVIKSGGEWISSIDLENIAVATRRWPRPR
jgi:3-(methylthio)propionyl---CoA ligase